VNYEKQNKTKTRYLSLLMIHLNKDLNPELMAFSPILSGCDFKPLLSR